MRRQGENTTRLYLFIKNEAELTGLKAQDEDSKATVRLLPFSKLAIPASLKQCALL